MKTNTYLPINWTDGVKLTKDHFINNYFNFVTTVNDYTNVSVELAQVLEIVVIKDFI
jgi:hypothetical protein